MKVRIIECSSHKYWYANKIGEEYEVVQEDPWSYKVDPLSQWIWKEDCEIVSEEEIAQDKGLFTGQQLIETAERLQQESLDIMKSKNHDYAGEYAFSNFVDSAELAGITERQSILVGIGTKYSRLKNLLKNNKTPNNESIEDTLKDLINYCYILLANMSKNKE